MSDTLRRRFMGGCFVPGFRGRSGPLVEVDRRMRENQPRFSGVCKSFPCICAEILAQSFLSDARKVNAHLFLDLEVVDN